MATRYLTKSEKRVRTIKRLTGFFVVVLLALGCYFAYQSVASNLRVQSAASVENAIRNAAKQCCAIEGSYPSSLSYLEENYGLVINSDDYVITYQRLGDNTMPSVNAVPR